MLDQLRFYFGHSFNDLRVNGRRTFFALLCIAAGVAAIVSLQTLGAMISDTLTGNLQGLNRGDIKAQLQGSFFRTDDSSDSVFDQRVANGELTSEEVESAFAEFTQTVYYISPSGLETMQDWLEENYPGQAELQYTYPLTDMTSIFLGSGSGTTVTSNDSGLAATQTTPLIINPGVYPFYEEVTSLDGTPLADLLTQPGDIVIDEKIAQALKAEVGAVVRVAGSERDYTVRGIVATETEVSDPFTGIFASQFGFYYLALDSFTDFGLQPRSDMVYIKLADPTRVTEISRAFEQAFPYLNLTTTEDLRETNQRISDQVNQLVTIMGLVSLLLGSIGIINTMQVIVQRRTVEIAVLKTLGLQANQVTILFLVEAFIMGILGSLLGVLLGWATTFVIRGVAESLVAQSLPFRLVPAAVINGVLVGTLVTTIFGFLPTLAAGQVRPGVVLRPNDTIVLRAGCLRSLVAIAVIIVALALVASTILGNFGTALGVTIGAFFAAGFLIALLNGLIWLIGRLLPSLGIVDLKISLRQMLVSRGRGAITLLALVVGVFSLSIITLFADSINQALSFALGEGIGGNVVITGTTNTLPLIEAGLSNMEGVNEFHAVQSFQARVVGLEESDGTVLDREQLKERIEANAQNFTFFGEPPEDFDFNEVRLSALSNLTGREVDQSPTQVLATGRYFTPEDEGQPVIVLTQDNIINEARIDIGDKLIYQFGEGANAPRVAYTVIGIMQQSIIAGGFSGSGYDIPLSSVPDSARAGGSVQIVADVVPEEIPAVRRQLAILPGTFVLETAVFTKLLTALLGTFTAFPTMVALLGLVVGGVVIANSVALATLERKREIAVMKSIGLQRERVLGMLLIENGIMGLIGGLLGVGMGLAGLMLALSLGGGLSFIPYGTALLLMALCILVALVAAATTAWSASGEKPLNVLRYE
ncbi:MAG: ABC transporter permease [Anaerolineae bacterium]|nr:ABC transporter permease [Anaerolineae bacterium]